MPARAQAHSPSIRGLAPSTIRHVARVKEIAAHSGAVGFGVRPTVDLGLEQMFRRAALNEQRNEAAQFALLKPRILVLDYANNLTVWDFRKLLGKATLHGIDLRPLFLRHARHSKHRAGVWSTGPPETNWQSPSR